MRTPSLSLAALLVLAGCTEDRPADDVVAVRQGAPLSAPPAPEPDGRDVFEPDVGFFPNVGELPLEGISGLDTEAPADLPAGVTGLSWRDLSLREVYGEELRDLLYPDRADEGDAAFPAQVMRHDGSDVGIIGYMIPLEWEGDGVPRFLLVRDLAACCFGGTPMADEWVEVAMAGEPAEYFAYEPVVVVGRLDVGAFDDDWGFAAGCYRLTADTVESSPLR